ncbi:DNA alkylation response protein [Cupriavidus sp. USMAA2-4]|uniref:DNA alkylation response protein n=1 Tax=Cupriavidus malaysiensis TaxID=367825 RepID=A0ABN4TQJ9_9BURK|nr:MULTISPECIES: acyl-CoA dehydrogenase family protein [Cupriavidus]AOY96278.1 DNA alkylation response protein [Cupriavidus sp. USMAA2-4]AOZ09318.1 DNA alkylation response protein [Cupriavidus malaysiensis]
MTWKTHDVSNQVPELKDYNLYATDLPLQRAVERGGAGWHAAELSRQGAELGSEAMLRRAEAANRYTPELHTHSRLGERIDQVRFHPAWHEVMQIARRSGLANLPFADSRPSAWAAYGAAQYMHSQIESGSLCPTNMTQACIPVLQKEPALYERIGARLLARDHDARDLPAEQKTSITVGMGMTEKQGGSDVRANTTRAVSLRGEGRGAEYLLTGHKWFFSAPMCDAHLVLANTEAGSSCFYVPRWRPDGSKNAVEIQRLKDKVGNRSNSSSEVEFKEAWGILVGEEGRGIPTILEMATYSRLNCALSSAGFLRQALAQALHYARHRRAFGKMLVEQPLMRRLLADLALESEAAMLLSMDLASAFGEDDEAVVGWRRVLTPVAKFWVCKRAVELTGEAMEVFGGNGYVEDGPMGRLFRDAPVNSIWEGSGNVMCLDVLRAISRKPGDFAAVLARLQALGGGDARVAASLRKLQDALALPPEVQEAEARRFTTRLALTAQACLMLRHADPLAAEAFVASRFDADWGAVAGISAGLGRGADEARLLEMAWAA